jgi:hypothetical protein
MQNIQNTIARIEQQKGRQLTDREKLVITHHEKAHAATKPIDHEAARRPYLGRAV